jgi:hypothetical protein
VDGRTDGELRVAAQHTCFELLQMVDATVARARSGEVAFLESALLHTRNMIEFFCKMPGQKITAGDFLPSWTPISTNQFSEANRVLNNWLSHLSWVRVDHDQTLPDQGWDLIPLVVDLVDLFETAFLANLPSDRETWFSGTVEVVRSKLKELTDHVVRSHFSATTTDTPTVVIQT